MEAQKPLAGVRVVELATYVAAPVCGRVLGDWGAEVIKVESLSGDIWRVYGKNFGVPADDSENPTFDLPNANKRFISLNIKTPAGMDILRKLLAQADVFVTNNRPAPLKRMGLDYETLKKDYPRLIYALITGYGEEGPEAGKPGFDTVSFWASGGFMADMRIDSPGSYPIYTPAGVADVACGSLLFGGISAALYAREKTGMGDKVSISLFGAAVWMMGVMNMIAQEGYDYQYPRTRYSGKPVAIPYCCADGEWIMTSILEFDRYVPVLYRALGLDYLLDDPRFNNEAAVNKGENRALLIPILEERFAQESADHWRQVLQAHDIVCDRLVHYREITKSEQAKVNHYIDEVTFNSGHKAWMPRPSVQSENLGVPEYRLSAPVGADTRDVLKDLGYSDDEIRTLAGSKSVRCEEV